MVRAAGVRVEVASHHSIIQIAFGSAMRKAQAGLSVSAERSAGRVASVFR